MGYGLEMGCDALKGDAMRLMFDTQRNPGFPSWLLPLMLMLLRERTVLRPHSETSYNSSKQNNITAVQNYGGKYTYIKHKQPGYDPQIHRHILKHIRFTTFQNPRRHKNRNP